MQLQRLRDYIRKLELRCYLVHASVAVLDRLVCEVLADINVLGTLTSPNHMISPLDARRVVLEHRSVVRLAKLHVGQEGAEVDDLDSHLRCLVVFCLRRGERHTLLPVVAESRFRVHAKKPAGAVVHVTMGEISLNLT
jgi:hypothetical protein